MKIIIVMHRFTIKILVCLIIQIVVILYYDVAIMTGIFRPATAGSAWPVSMHAHVMYIRMYSVTHYKGTYINDRHFIIMATNNNS